MNIKYPCYHISTYGDLDKDRERNGMPESKFNELMGYKYKVTCNGCNRSWYKTRMSEKSIKAHENGGYYCAKCGSHQFMITEI